MQRNHSVLTYVYGLSVVAMCCITYVAFYNYRKYVNEAVQGSENPLRNIFGQTLLGGEGFIKRVREFLRGKPLPSEIIARKEYTHYPSLREIAKQVSEAFGVEEGKVLLRKFHPASVVLQ